MKNFEGNIITALRNKDENLFKKVINEATIDLNDFLPGMRSAIIHILAHSGTCGMIKHFISSGADINLPDFNRVTPLHYALLYGKTENALCLLELDASVFYHDAKGMTALHLAILYEAELKVIEAILHKGIDSNVANIRDGNRPLHLLWNSNLYPSSYKLKTIKLLLAFGADVNARNLKGITPFLLVCKFGNPEVISNFCFQYGADIHSVCKGKKTALHYCTESGNEGAVEYLLNQGCNVNTRDILGQSALFYAIKNPKLINLLAQYGADISLTDNQGDTVLHNISKIRSLCTIKILKCFLELKPDIFNDVNAKRETPLQCAIIYCRLNSIHELNPNANNLISYIAIQIKLGKQIHEKNVELIEKVPAACNFYENCVSELNALEKLKISECSNVCLIEFLTKDVHKLSAYCRNEDLHIVLNSGVIFKNFPIYEESLRTNFINAKIRRLHLDLAMVTLQSLSSDTTNKLSYKYTNKIFQRMSRLQIQYFIDAFMFDGNKEYILPSLERLGLSFRHDFEWQRYLHIYFQNCEG